MSLGVIGAGFGRTGTTSLKQALEQLGFGPCYHFTELLKAGHARRWLDIAGGAEPSWESLLGNYRSCVDWPAAAFYRDIADHYPDAKVVLTMRDAQRWHDSLVATLLPLRRALSGWLPGVGDIARMTDAVIWQGTFDSRASDRQFAIARLAAHIDEVRACVPADRLLEFDVRDGWPPLCDFLGVAVPDEPFPHANDSAVVRRYIAAIRLAKLLVIVGLAGVVAAGATLFFR